MDFKDKLNEYFDKLNCTAKELSDISGISPATISRYRSGERTPEIDSDTFRQICEGLCTLSQRNKTPLSTEEITQQFCTCADIIAADKEILRRKLNTLISILDINLAKLGQYTNYEASALFRIRTGSRKASDPVKFAYDISGFISRENNSEKDRKILSELMNCTKEELADTAVLYERVRDWIISGQERPKDKVSGFLGKLNNFNLNEYIKSINFDKLKVPTAPFQLPTSKVYMGLAEMRTGELDFLKATVLSKSNSPVIIYSDMPIEEMAKDSDFSKKWVFGIALMLKKGLHLSMIHNLDRPFNEILLGLENFIPLYMTGQISPYFFDEPQNAVFLHSLKVSGTAAISGEAISGNFLDGKYYLTKNKEEVEYYRKRAQAMLSHAKPLMNIFTEKSADKLNDFLLEDSKIKGKRRSILSAPPLYSLSHELAVKILQRENFSAEEIQKVLIFSENQKKTIEEILDLSVIEDEISVIPKEEFDNHPISLSLSEIFPEKNAKYTFDEYSEHIHLTEEFEKSHEKYSLKKTAAFVFRNLQINIHTGKWVKISKSDSPTIHFVIHHPKLCRAIEQFVPTIAEKTEPTD